MSSNLIVPITGKDIKDYLDREIESWRKIRDEHHSEIARYYIDALQDMRIYILGECG